MQKFKQKCLFVLCGLLCVGFLCYLLLAPRGLYIDIIPDDLYLDEPVTEQDFSVFYKSLVGIKFSCKDYYYDQDGDTLSVSAKHFTKKQSLQCHVPVDHKVIYDTKVYAGQKIKKKQMHVTSVYDDGERKTTEFMISKDLVPLSKKSVCQVAVNSGVFEWTTDVVSPSQVVAEYKKTPKLGDLFDKSQVSVKLVYPDSTDAKVKDFEITEPPAYLTGRLTVLIKTDYGKTNLVIEPQDLQPLTLTYADPVYVGDTLDTSKFKLSMTGSDGNPIDITDFEIENPGEIKTLTNVLVHSKFGDAMLTIDPVRVDGCMGDPDGDLIEGQTPKFKVLHLYYTDGQVKDLSPDDVEFTNLESIKDPGKCTVYFLYHGVYYWFEQKLLPKKIVDLRQSGADIPTDCDAYELNDEQVRAIAVIAQRLANDDMTIAAAEISLMANRYEIYSQDKAKKEGAYLLKYIIESGYWGSDIADYVNTSDPIEDLLYLTQDILINGYRSIPLYIDERAGSSDIKEMNSSEFEEGQTDITKLDDTKFRFYKFLSDNSDIAYGYTDIGYGFVKHAELPESKPKTKVTHIEDEDGIIIQTEDGEVLGDETDLDFDSELDNETDIPNPEWDDLEDPGIVIGD